jgi:hypothetical protein
MAESKEVPTPTKARRPWEPPALKQVGTVAEVLRGGTGKLTFSSADTGDTNKPKGQK